jgi:hypothetical protein
MATSYGKTALPVDVWTEVTGSLPSTAGVTWQNVGHVDLLISLGNASAPASGEGQLLRPAGAFYDKNGSTKIWAKALGDAGFIAATKD